MAALLRRWARAISACPLAPPRCTGGSRPIPSCLQNPCFPSHVLAHLSTANCEAPLSLTQLSSAVAAWRKQRCPALDTATAAAWLDACTARHHTPGAIVQELGADGALELVEGLHCSPVLRRGRGRAGLHRVTALLQASLHADSADALHQVRALRLAATLGREPGASVASRQAVEALLASVPSLPPGACMDLFAALAHSRKLHSRSIGAIFDRLAVALRASDQGTGPATAAQAADFLKAAAMFGTPVPASLVQAVGAHFLLHLPEDNCHRRLELLGPTLKACAELGALPPGMVPSAMAAVAQLVRCGAAADESQPLAALADAAVGLALAFVPSPYPAHPAPAAEPSVGEGTAPNQGVPEHPPPTWSVRQFPALSLDEVEGSAAFPEPVDAASRETPAPHIHPLVSGLPATACSADQEVLSLLEATWVYAAKCQNLRSADARRLLFSAAIAAPGTIALLAGGGKATRLDAELPSHPPSLQRAAHGAAHSMGVEASLRKLQGLGALRAGDTVEAWRGAVFGRPPAESPHSRCQAQCAFQLATLLRKLHKYQVQRDFGQPPLNMRAPVRCSWALPDVPAVADIALPVPRVVIMVDGPQAFTCTPYAWMLTMAWTAAAVRERLLPTSALEAHIQGAGSGEDAPPSAISPKAGAVSRALHQEWARRAPLSLQYTSWQAVFQGGSDSLCPAPTVGSMGRGGVRPEQHWAPPHPPLPLVDHMTAADRGVRLIYDATRMHQQQVPVADLLSSVGMPFNVDFFMRGPLAGLLLKRRGDNAPPPAAFASQHLPLLLSPSAIAQHRLMEAAGWRVLRVPLWVVASHLAIGPRAAAAFVQDTVLPTVQALVQETA